MTQLSGKLFIQRLLDRFARTGLDMARNALQSKGSVQSRQLIDSMEIINLGETSPDVFEARIFTSPYYAVFVHEGSGPASRDISRPPFIWYKDPLLDPRLDNGRTPPRVAQLRHLTGEKFRSDLEAGLLIVTMNVGRRRNNPFFSNEPNGGMFGFRKIAGAIAGQEMSVFVRTEMGDMLRVRGSVTVSI